MQVADSGQAQAPWCAMRDRAPLYVFLVFLALLGVRYVPSGDSKPTAENKTPEPNRPEMPAALSTGSDLRFGEVLRRHCGRSSDELAGPTRDRLDFLIVTVPDPNESSAANNFDTLLDAVERAVELRGFSLDRFWLPWQGRERELFSFAVDREKIAKAVPAMPATGPGSEPLAHSQPGVLLFRKWEGSAAGYHQLALLVVGENATSGIHKDAFRAAISFVASTCSKTKAVLKRLNVSRPPPGRELSLKIPERGREDLVLPVCERYEQIRVLGPTFSGSQSSLESVLRPWYKEFETPISFISGTATAFRRASFESFFPQGAITFRSTLHHDTTLDRELFNYLNHIGVEAQNTVAVLSDSTTEYGAVVANPDLPPGWKVGRISFPYHLAEMRLAYQRSASEGRPSLPELPSAVAKLPVPVSEGSSPRDVKPALTPYMSAVATERLLASAMNTIRRERFQHVVLSASSTMDSMFLATAIRQTNPEVRLILHESDALVNHPNHAALLRGSFVVSTYPLYSKNQSWSTRHGDDARRVLFPSSSEYGYYNATLALLEDPSRPRPVDPARPNDKWFDDLVEYRPPLVFKSGSPHVPPVWISVLGQDGPYPVSCIPVDGKAKDPDTGKCEPYVFTPDIDAQPAAGAPAAPAAATNLPPSKEPGAFKTHHVGLCIWSLVLLIFLSMSIDSPRHLSGWASSEQEPFVLTLLRGLCLISLIGLCLFMLDLTLIPMRIAFGSSAEQDLGLTQNIVAPLLWHHLMLPITFLFILAGLFWYALPIAYFRTIGVRPGQAHFAAKCVILVMSFIAAIIVSGFAFLRQMNDPLQALFYLERATTIASGVSTVLPISFLTIGLFFFGRVFLHDQENLERFEDCTVFRPTDKRVPSANLVGRATFEAWIRRNLTWWPFVSSSRPNPNEEFLSAIYSRVRRALDARYLCFRDSFNDSPYKSIVIFGVATFVVYEVSVIWLPSPDGFIIDWVAKLLLFANFAAILTVSGLSLYLWKRTRELLGLIGILPPLREALSRLQRDEVALLGRYLASARPMGNRLGRVREFRRQEVIEASKNVLGLIELIRAETDEGSLRDALEKCAACSSQPRDETAPAYFRLLSMLWLRMGKEGSPASPRLPTVNADAAQAASSTDLASSESRFLQDEVLEKVLPVSQYPEPEREALKKWLILAEHYTALEITSFVSQFFVLLRNRIGYMAWAPLLLLLAIVSYPFAAQHLMLIAVGTLIVVVTLVGYIRLSQVERDEVLSLMLHTSPHRLDLSNGSFILVLAQYVFVPLTVLAALSTDISNMMHMWFDPIFRFLR